MVTSWRVMSRSSMSDKPSNFLCFRNISLILKHEKLLRRSCRLKAVDDWNFIKNNSPSQFFNSYNEAYSNKTRYTLNLFWQNLSTHLVFISWVLPEMWVQWYINTISPLPHMFLVGTIHYSFVQVFKVIY